MMSQACPVDPWKCDAIHWKLGLQNTLWWESELFWKERQITRTRGMHERNNWSNLVSGANLLRGSAHSQFPIQVSSVRKFGQNMGGVQDKERQGQVKFFLQNTSFLLSGSLSQLGSAIWRGGTSMGSIHSRLKILEWSTCCVESKLQHHSLLVHLPVFVHLPMFGLPAVQQAGGWGAHVQV